MKPRGTLVETFVDPDYRPEVVLRPPEDRFGNARLGVLGIYVVQHVATGALWAKDVHLDDDGRIREAGDWHEVAQISACVPRGSVVSPGSAPSTDGMDADSSEDDDVVRAIASAPPREPPLHVVDQSGQPYGSVRRCCNACGLMVHPGMKFVNSMAEWRASQERRCLGGSR